MADLAAFCVDFGHAQSNLEVANQVRKGTSTQGEYQWDPVVLADALRSATLPSSVADHRRGLELFVATDVDQATLTEGDLKELMSFFEAADEVCAPALDQLASPTLDELASDVATAVSQGDWQALCVQLSLADIMGEDCSVWTPAEPLQSADGSSSFSSAGQISVYGVGGDSSGYTVLGDVAWGPNWAMKCTLFETDGWSCLPPDKY
jgi:hypothetical protein